MSRALDRVRERKELEAGGATAAELEAFDNEPYEKSSQPSPGDRRRMRAHAARQERPMHDAYRAGQSEGRRSSSSSTSSRSTSSRSTSSRRRRAPAAARRARQQITRPIVGQATSGLRVLGLAFTVVFLYDLLQSADVTAGFLAAPAKALAWLSSPHAIVPTKNG